MATLVNDSNINWNGSWQTTSKIDVIHASTGVSVGTGGSVSATWNGNNSNTDKGALVYITAINACTVTVTLQEFATAVWNDRVSTTLAVTSSTLLPSWFYFKFGSTHTETAGTANYRIQVKTSTSTITCRGETTTPTNVAVIQVLNATASAAAGDNLYICGVTQASSVNPTAAAVTVNINNSSTIFGGIWINNAGTLQYQTTAATTTYLKQAGAISVSGVSHSVYVENGGYFNIGTSGTPIPADSTATFEMAANSANRLFNVAVGGRCNLQGYPKFATGSYFRCNTTDAIAVVGDRTVSTSIDVSTQGWAANDQVMISTTAANGSAQTEIKTITSVSTNSLTISTDWSYTHLAGAELCNLTRNVRFIGSGASTSYELRLQFVNTTSGQINFDFVRFEGLRSNTNYYCCIGPLYSSGAYRYNIDNCVFYDLYGSTTGRAALMHLGDNTITNCVFWMNYNGLYALYGMCYAWTEGTKMTDCTIAGITSYGIAPYTVGMVRLLRVHIYDKINNTTAGYGIANGSAGDWYLDRCKIWGLRATGTSSRAIDCSGGWIRCYHCIFGNDGTNNSDCYYDTMIYYDAQLYLYNCKSASAVPMYYSTTYYYYPEGRLSAQRYQQVTNRHRTVTCYGNICDQVTGGQTETWARSSAGYCTYLDPNQTTAGRTLNWDFYVPVTADVRFSVAFYVKTTQTSSGPTLTCTIYDSYDNYTELLSAQTVTLTAASNWTLFTSTGVTPTDTGFCRVRLACLNGSSTGDVGIDDVHLIF